MAKKTVLVLALLVSALTFSCMRGRGPWRDGWYTAIAADYDAYGWKEFVTICVNNGVITSVEYNAVNAGGFVKSWDREYMAVMKAVSGTYPQEYTRYYAAQLLQNQGHSPGGLVPEIDCLAGSTESWETFLALAAAVLEKARSGDTAVALLVFGEGELPGEAGE